MNRIVALRVFIERVRDFRIGLLAACVDLCKAFDSVNRDVLWRILTAEARQPDIRPVFW